MLQSDSNQKHLDKNIGGLFELNWMSWVRIQFW